MASARKITDSDTTNEATFSANAPAEHSPFSIASGDADSALSKAV